MITRRLSFRARTGWCIFIGQLLTVFGNQRTSPLRASIDANRMQRVPQPISARMKDPAEFILLVLMAQSRSSR